MNRVLKVLAAGLVVAFGVVPLLAAPAAGDKQPVAGGYCPVAYAKMGKAVKGNPSFSSEQDGRLYNFASAEAKKMFDAEPAKYRIAYDGWCATGVAMGKKIASSPELLTAHKGATYLFSSADAKAMFDKDPDMTIAKASESWPKVK